MAKFQCQKRLNEFYRGMGSYLIIYYTNRLKPLAFSINDPGDVGLKVTGQGQLSQKQSNWP